MRVLFHPPPVLAAWGPLPVRLIVGYGFMAHGCAKLIRGPETFAAVLHTLGVPFPLLNAWMTTLVEVIGGAMVFWGLYIPIVAIPMMIVLVAALLTVHLPYGFFSIKLVQVTPSGTKFGPVGYEILLLYFAGLASLCLSGPGRFSLDDWLGSAVSKTDDRVCDESPLARSVGVGQSEHDAL